MFVFCVSLFLVIAAKNTDGVNIALGRPATQSSTFKEIYTAERGVDGNTGKRFFKDTCFHTKCDDFKPQWTVHLDGDYTIETLILHNPEEAHSRLKNIRIEVFETDPSEPNAVAKLCATIGTTPAADGVAVTITCAEGVWGRYVRISKNIGYTLWHRSRCESLQLCEVEIEGKKYINCQDGFIRNGDSCYYFTRQGVVGSWIEAQQYCETLNSYLVVIDTAEEDEFIRTQIQNGQQDFYWIGATDILVEGTFQWTSRIPNELVTYTNWGPGQPNNQGGNQNCVELWRGFGFAWNDDNCQDDSGFVCEQK